MLIDDYIKIKLNSKNYKHYEELKYELPKRINRLGKLSVCFGEEILVKTTDLPKGSHIKVRVRCDECEREYEVCYETYSKVNKNGKSYCKKCASRLFNSGKNNPNWNKDKTEEERQNSRDTKEYCDFIKKVLKRDDYTCKCCKKKSQGDVVVHHLDGYNWCVKKRTDEKNGITLCEKCHKNFHSQYGNGNNTKEQFEEWIGKTIELLKYNEELPTARKIYCIEDNKIYESIYELSKEISNGKYKCITKIYDVCNHKKKNTGGYNKSYKGKHYLWLSEYEKMSKEDVEKYLEWCKPNQKKEKLFKRVICLTTNKVFNSIKEASEYYGIRKDGISRACSGKSSYCGIKDGLKLTWSYYNN